MSKSSLIGFSALILVSFSVSRASACETEVFDSTLASSYGAYFQHALEEFAPSGEDGDVDGSDAEPSIMWFNDRLSTATRTYGLNLLPDGSSAGGHA